MDDFLGLTIVLFCLDAGKTVPSIHHVSEVVRDFLAICGPHNLCVCTTPADVDKIPTDDNEPLSISNTGDLIMTELLIDGEPTEDEEMVDS